MVGAPFSVRLASRADAAFLVSSARKMFWESEFKNIPEESVTAGVHRILADPAKGFYVVAEHGDKNAGSLLVSPLWIDLIDGCTWWLQCIYVEQAARRKGCLRALYGFVKEQAKHQEEVRALRLRVHPKNSIAVKAYERLGMSAEPYMLFNEVLMHGASRESFDV